MEQSKRIAVIGATGRLGSHVVDVIGERGHQAVPASPSSGVDVVTGDGLAEALERADTVIDVSTPPTPEQAAATEFFESSAGNLHRVGTDAGVKRLVVVSIVGADRFTGGTYAGYYVAKVAQERAALSGPIPVSILRATQFHEFVGQLLDWSRQGDVSYVPDWKTQLVAARSVAEALVDLALDPGSNGSTPEPFPEIAGPRVESLVEVARLLAERRGEPARVEVGSEQDEPDHELFEGGGLLPGPEATLAGPTYEEWLQQQS
jgi:uncharacterized protein YbjT (DUF2867 family)